MVLPFQIPHSIIRSFKYFVSASFMFLWMNLENVNSGLTQRTRNRRLLSIYDSSVCIWLRCIRFASLRSTRLSESGLCQFFHTCIYPLFVKLVKLNFVVNQARESQLMLCVINVECRMRRSNLKKFTVLKFTCLIILGGPPLVHNSNVQTLLRGLIAWLVLPIWHKFSNGIRVWDQIPPSFRLTINSVLSEKVL